MRVRMEAVLATSAIFDSLLTLSSQKVIKSAAALISVGIAIAEFWDIRSCEYPVFCGREVWAYIEVVLGRAGEEIQIWRRARIFAFDVPNRSATVYQIREPTRDDIKDSQQIQVPCRPIEQLSNWLKSWLSEINITVVPK
jgi:hypothetical protein